MPVLNFGNDDGDSYLSLKYFGPAANDDSPDSWIATYLSKDKGATWKKTDTFAYRRNAMGMSTVTLNPAGEPCLAVMVKNGQGSRWVVRCAEDHGGSWRVLDNAEFDKPGEVVGMTFDASKQIYVMAVSMPESQGPTWMMRTAEPR